MNSSGNPKKQERVSLRGKVTLSGIAAELISLLETISADGTITDDEIADLKRWLEENRATDLPAIAFLVSTLEQILADGNVTVEERTALHRAVERILPKELREKARGARQARELIEKARTQEAKAQAQSLRKKNRPVISLNFMTAGTRFEGRGEIIDRDLEAGQAVYLVRDPDNPHDPNAIEIKIDSEDSIGYVPREYAATLAPLLDQDFRQITYCTKILQGRAAPIPVVQAALYEPDATTAGALSPHQAAQQLGEGGVAKRTQERKRQAFTGGCAVGCACVVAVALALLLFTVLRSR